MMNKWFLVALLLALLVFQDCNTVAGIGKDLTYTAEKIGQSMNEE